MREMNKHQANTTEMVEMEFNCLTDYTQIFDDYWCMLNVRIRYYEHRDELCDCKPPCHEMEYDLTISSSQWPAAGSELNTAYAKLVHSKTGALGVWLNRTMSENPSSINSNVTACGSNLTSNRIAQQIYDYLGSAEPEVVLKNFVRVSVYVKTRTVEQIEEVAAYTRVDLISDIGKR